jgi:D-serine deaminase-like pyridoxal phosphate-dependent protein
MIEKEAWYTVKNADGIDSPALLFYPERMKENIAQLKSIIDDPVRLRPHVKTHKTREVTCMMMDAGIQKFKCATLAEAEMLGTSHVPDVLLAYQPVGPKLLRLISLIKNFPATSFSCLVDNLESAATISAAALKAKLIVPVYIDLNVGMNRTGILPGKEAIELYRICSLLNGIRPVGLHFYDGHVRDRDIEKRRILSKELLTEVERLRNDLIKLGYEAPRLIAGGTPSFPIYAQAKEIECSPGTFIFWDKGYQETLPEQKFLIAALVLTRIVSLPSERKICLDLGYKSIASENELYSRVHFLNAPDLKIVSQSEEHLVAEAPGAHRWKVGDLIYALPVHICPTVAMYESAFIVEKAMANCNWKISARDRRIHF